MKSRFILTAIAALFSMTLLNSCEKVKGKGDVVTQTRTTGNYTSIGLSMSATVYFTQDSSYSLQISGQENILDEIVTEVNGNQLVIRVRNGVTLGSHEPIRVTISSPDVTALDVSGSGDIYTENTWTKDDISTTISGSGNINLASIDVGHLTANISGSGSIKATAGKAEREDLTISGSGVIDLRSVEAGTVYTTTSGSGDTYLHATDLLDVTISGSGNVWYYGTPVINTHISGSGNIKRM
jgi:hypothetical protein